MFIFIADWHLSSIENFVPSWNFTCVFVECLMLTDKELSVLSGCWLSYCLNSM